MGTGRDEGLPDHDGGSDRYGQWAGRPADLSGTASAPAEPYATDPYAIDASASDPYSTDPYAGDPLLGAGPAPGAPSAQQPAGPHPVGSPRYGDFRAPLPSSGAAIAGFVLGLVGLVMCMGLTSPFGIYFSAQGMKETAPTSSEPRDGRGLAIAGLVTSLVGLIPLGILLIYAVIIVVAIIMAATS